MKKNPFIPFGRKNRRQKLSSAQQISRIIMSVTLIHSSVCFCLFLLSDSVRLKYNKPEKIILKKKYNLYSCCVGCSGLDADPRSLDVYITYVRMHNGKVNTLLCLWETSAVNKKWSSTIAGRVFFCACVVFFLVFFFTDFTDEAHDLHFVWLVLLLLGQKTHKNTRNQTNRGHRNGVFHCTYTHTRTPSLHMHYPSCTSKDSSSVRFTARSALFREQTARLQEPARGKTAGGGLET